MGLTPGSGRSPGKWNGYPFQYSCLENSRDRGAWWATVYGVAKSRTRLSDFTYYYSVAALGVLITKQIVFQYQLFLES